jgi:hypothetical protein
MPFCERASDSAILCNAAGGRDELPEVATVFLRFRNFFD